MAPPCKAAVAPRIGLDLAYHSGNRSPPDGMTMAVSADLLLNTRSTETRSSDRATSMDKSASQDSTRFSQVYAQERQARSDVSQERPARQAERQEKTTAANDKPSSVAESGKDLPEADVPLATPETTVNPLAFLGLPLAVDIPVEETAELPLAGLGTKLLEEIVDEPEAQAGEALLGERPRSDEEATRLLDGPEPDVLPVAPLAEVVVAPVVVAAVQPQVNVAVDEGEVEAESEEAPELPLASLAGKSERNQDGLVSTQRVDEAPAGQENQSQERPQTATTYAAVQEVVSGRAAPIQVPGQPVAIQQAGSIDAVVDRVMWLSSQNLKSAEIQLDPAELGRLEVRIDMNKEQAQVTFLSAHAGVRDTLEGQLPRLREMFAQQGMNLLEANVSDQSQARDQQQESGGTRTAGAGSAAEDEQLLGVSEISSDRTGGDRGLVDYYA
ncbi:flagellar hook-length control protein FliK [Stutzerimonas kirkiae]|nr:flagellar hook-length control protein FliK [Stutzerimonas kirkiae]